MKELKKRYNVILRQQNKAFEWFASSDFESRFKVEGEKFFNKALLKYNLYEKERIEILKSLEKNNIKVSTEEIISGFEIF